MIGKSVQGIHEADRVARRLSQTFLSGSVVT